MVKRQCQWLHIESKESNYSADPYDHHNEDDPENDEEWRRQTRFKDSRGDEAPNESNEFLPRLRRQKSLTLRSQYINKKELRRDTALLICWYCSYLNSGVYLSLRVCVGTWNVGGEVPPDDLDIDDWLGINEPADIYVLGLQEMIPLDRGYIFGVEDTRPVPKWENIIRETLNRVQSKPTNIKSFSDPPSPSKFKPSDDIEELLLENDSDIGEEVQSFDEEHNVYDKAIADEALNTSLLASSKSFRTCDSFKSKIDAIDFLAEIDLEALLKRKTRSSYVKIVSKQMVGIFITIWIRRCLRKHVQNLKLSTVAVGVNGYLGNKGSISVSMSLYQTFFCFICSHLTAGEKEENEHKRNADVLQIHQKTHFYSISDIGLPKNILDHERIIWFGDLNYRINLSYEKTRDLISKKEWSKLVERDQLVEKGVFDGWSEGILNFPPTYKYEISADKYVGEDPKVGRRTPAWCDRILSYGNGMRLLSYKRNELKLSDHRPVTATYMTEVEVFSPGSHRIYEF